MAFATGGEHGIRYIAESVWGETPSPSPELISLRHTSCNLILTKETFQSAELRTDRQISDFRHGVFQVKGDLGFELSYAEFDPILEAALGGTWAVAYNLTNQTVSVNQTTKKFTRSSGSWVTDGVRVGDRITTSGFEAGGNNGTFTVSAVSTLEITCATATGLVTVSDDAGVSVTTSTQTLKAGVTDRSFTIERAFGDITQYGAFTGCVVDGLTLSIRPNAIVTGTFSMIGKTVTYSGTPLDSTPTASQTNSPYDAFSGSLLEGGSAIALVTGLDLKLVNGGEAAFVVGSQSAANILLGRSNITGTLTAYFQDLSMLDKFIDETESSLEVVLGTLSSGKALTFKLPRIKYGGAENPVTNEKNIILNMPFQAILDSTSSTNIQIWRTPAA